MKKPDDYYAEAWFRLAKKALEVAKTYLAAGLSEQAIRVSNIGQYCMKRREKAQLKFMTKQREKTQQTAGTIFAAIILIVIIHYFLTHSLC